jgi:hypothetical protein
MRQDISRYIISRLLADQYQSQARRACSASKPRTEAKVRKQQKRARPRPSQSDT